MRLGGPLSEKTDSPDTWIAAHRALGYTAAYCPLNADASDDAIRDYAAAAKRADIVIAEVGAWSNPISREQAEANAAIAKCQQQLALADRIGAICCVNIAGSRGEKWDGPSSENFTDDAFDLIVQSVRKIIDAVKPKRTVYTLETMPWAPPDSADSYLELLLAIDRRAFAVHLDPVNLIASPRRAADTGAVIRECFAKLGPHIVGCHAKDIRYTQHLTVHLDECRPGTGLLDYRVYLQEMARLPADTPLMLEHLPSAEEYRLAAEHLRSVASEVGVGWR